MIPFLVNIINFFRSIWKGLQDSEFQVLLTLTAFTLISGTFFYHYVEGWSILDALYFSVITLTTVGYGDYAPSTPVSKVFTIVYIIMGMGIIIGFINKVASDRLARRRGEPPDKED